MKLYVYGYLSAFIYFLLWSSILLSPQSAMAACSSPTGQSGQITYQSPQLLFCDGTSWTDLLASGGGGADNMGDHTASQNIVLGTNYLSGDGGDEGIYVDSAGNVGVGTTSPSGNFHISSTTDATLLIDADTGNSDEFANPMIKFTQDGGTHFFALGITGNDGFDPQGNALTGVIQNSGFLYTQDTPIQFAPNGTLSMTMATNGRVGIGTSTPGYDLHVANSGDVDLVVDGGSNSDVAIRFREGGTEKWKIEHDGNGSMATADALVINYNATAGNNWFNINPTGEVGLGDGTPDAHLEVSANGSTGGSIFMLSSNDGNDGDILNALENGDIGIGITPTEALHVNGNVLADAYLYTSDIRLKKNIQPMEQSLDKLISLDTVLFQWKKPESEKSDRQKIGLIAQQVQREFPQAVSQSDDGYLRVDYLALVAPIIDALREVYDGLLSNEKEIISLIEKVEFLESENKRLSEQNKNFEDRLRNLEESINRQPSGK